MEVVRILQWLPIIWDCTSHRHMYRPIHVKIVCGDTLEKVLVEEAVVLGATLLSTSSRHFASWQIQGIASYCSRHASPRCSVV
ncbi:hypothetical protein MPTK1_Vg00087 [Marchantia polymorpha subsp. ruderalis]|nr:hypothetical protein Mp_Vg00087 [Marchantia polymorpha subsp. ruderalis]